MANKPVSEEIIRREIRSALIYQLGFDAFHLPDHKMTLESRPDLLAYAAPIAIEVKKFEPNVRDNPTFNLGNLRTSQRKWFETWTGPKEVGGRNNWGYFAIGTSVINPRFPRRCIWVIPWEDWREFELLIINDRPQDRTEYGHTIFASQVDFYFDKYRMSGGPGKFKFADDHPILDVPGGGHANWMNYPVEQYKCVFFKEPESRTKARIKMIEKVRTEE